MEKVNFEDIELTFTPAALAELKLIVENDYTLEGQYFRLKIDGKGCNGFDYALGFTEKDKDDFEYISSDQMILIDPFTAFYCRKGTIDYIRDFENDVEGFHYCNRNEKAYRGKFFKDESKVPEKL